MKPQYYPSYIPKKWIHYTHSKKKRIRKKYQNRIFRYAQQHARDIETITFLAIEKQTRLGMSTAEAMRSAVELGRLFTSPPPIRIGDQLISNIEELTATPDFGEFCNPTVSYSLDSETIERINEEFQKLAEAITDFFIPIVDCFENLLRKLKKCTRNLVDHVLCHNRHWWHMANHHKKYRIRKKYRNMIRREAEHKARSLLPSFLKEIERSETEEGTKEETSDDEDGP